MAILPGDEANPINVPTPTRPIVSYEGGIAERAQVARGEALAGLGETVTNAALKIQDTQDRLARSKAEQDFITKKIDLDQQFANDRDPATAPQRYRAALGDAMNEAGQGIVSPMQRADYQNSMARFTVYGVNEMVRQSAGKLRDQGRADTKDAVDQGVQAALRAPDEPTRMGLFVAVQDRLKAAEADGLISHSEGDQLWRKTRNDYGNERGKMLVDANPDMAVKALGPSGIGADGTPTFTPTNDWRDLIEPSHRMDLVRMAQQRSDALLNHQIALESRNEMLAQRHLRENQAQNFGTMYARALGGDNPPTIPELQEAARTQQITPQMSDALINVASGRRASVDDVNTMLPLAMRSQNGGDPDFVGDIAAAVTNRTLRAETADALLKTAAAKTEKQHDQVERASFATLRSYMGFDANMQPMLDLEKGEKAQQVGAWVQAQNEWNNRVLVGKEDPTQVLPDMMAKFARTALPRASLPAPRYGQIQTPDDIGTVTRATQDAFDAGSLTPDQFESQKRLIKTYADQMQEEARKVQQKADADKNARKGVQPRGK